MAAGLAGAGISAGTSLLGGLFGAASARKKQQRQLAAQKEQQALALREKGISDLSKGQQQAFSNLVQNFGRALGV